MLSWYLRPPDGGRSRAMPGRHAVYWPGGTAAVHGLSADLLPKLVQEARRQFGATPITLDVYGALASNSTPSIDAALGAAGFRWARDFPYLAHVGPRTAPTISDLRVMAVGGANSHDAMMVREHGFGGRSTMAGIAAAKARPSTEWYGVERGFLAYRRRVPVVYLLQRQGAEGGFIKHLAIVPAEQGRGIGTLLLRRALRHQPAGRWMVINTTTDNRGALRLYRREGFTDPVVVRRQYHKTKG